VAVGSGGVQRWEGGGVNVVVLGAVQGLSFCGSYQWEVELVEGGLYRYDVAAVPMLLVAQRGGHQNGARQWMRAVQYLSSDASLIKFLSKPKQTMVVVGT
jgi:hypothetical protein